MSKHIEEGALKQDPSRKSDANQIALEERVPQGSGGDSRDGLPERDSPPCQDIDS